MRGATLKALIFGLLLPIWAEAFLVAKLNLTQLASLSDHIFVGRCISVKTAEDSNGRPVQYVTYQISETLKGDIQETVTFKQILMPNDTSYGRETVTTAMSDLPAYKEGEEALVFLSDATDSGLTAPVGLGQGKFVIVTGKDGRRRISNVLKNRGIFQGMARIPKVQSLSLTSRQKKMLTNPPSDLFLEDVLPLVKGLVE